MPRTPSSRSSEIGRNPIGPRPRDVTPLAACLLCRSWFHPTPERSRLRGLRLSRQHAGQWLDGRERFLRWLAEPPNRAGRRRLPTDPTGTLLTSGNRVDGHGLSLTRQDLPPPTARPAPVFLGQLPHAQDRLSIAPSFTGLTIDTLGNGAYYIGDPASGAAPEFDHHWGPRRLHCSSGVPFEANRTYFIVAHMRSGSVFENDTATLYINPTPGLTPPSGGVTFLRGTLGQVIRGSVSLRLRRHSRALTNCGSARRTPRWAPTVPEPSCRRGNARRVVGAAARRRRRGSFPPCGHGAALTKERTQRIRNTSIRPAMMQREMTAGGLAGSVPPAHRTSGTRPPGIIAKIRAARRGGGVYRVHPQAGVARDEAEQDEQDSRDGGDQGGEARAAGAEVAADAEQDEQHAEDDRQGSHGNSFRGSNGGGSVAKVGRWGHAPPRRGYGAPSKAPLRPLLDQTAAG